MDTVLVVTENQELTDLLGYFLKTQERRAIFATNAADGIRMTEEQGPDLVLLDLMMPEGEAWHTMQGLLSEDNTVSIPTIAITAGGPPRERQPQFREYGVMAVLIKPFDLEELADSIDRALASGRR